MHGGHGDREPVSELNAIIVPEPPEGDNALDGDERYAPLRRSPSASVPAPAAGARLRAE